TTDAARVLGIAEHHTVEPLYATPQSDDFSARLSRIEDSMKAGVRLTKHRFKLDAPQPAEPVKVPRLYQHTDGRYGLSFGPAKFAQGEPAWYAVPIDVYEDEGR